MFAPGRVLSNSHVLNIIREVNPDLKLQVGVYFLKIEFNYFQKFQRNRYYKEEFNNEEDRFPERQTRRLSLA